MSRDSKQPSDPTQSERDLELTDAALAEVSPAELAEAQLLAEVLEAARGDASPEPVQDALQAAGVLRISRHLELSQTREDALWQELLEAHSKRRVARTAPVSESKRRLWMRWTWWWSLPAMAAMLLLLRLQWDDLSAGDYTPERAPRRGPQSSEAASQLPAESSHAVPSDEAEQAQSDRELGETLPLGQGEEGASAALARDETAPGARRAPLPLTAPAGRGDGLAPSTRAVAGVVKAKRLSKSTDTLGRPASPPAQDAVTPPATSTAASADRSRTASSGAAHSNGAPAPAPAAAAPAKKASAPAREAAEASVSREAEAADRAPSGTARESKGEASAPSLAVSWAALLAAQASLQRSLSREPADCSAASGHRAQICSHAEAVCRVAPAQSSEAQQRCRDARARCVYAGEVHRDRCAKP